MRYTVVLEQAADGGYVACVPALPGRVSQGDSRAEAPANIREAIELYIEDCRDARRPITEAPKLVPGIGSTADNPIADRQLIRLPFVELQPHTHAFPLVGQRRDEQRGVEIEHQ